ncbi:nucleolar complex-associated protein-domain-containing protein [Russula emetica]|nr:nucleolar complex-associated protein-domain-containing protein [Russula emetica]
MGAKVKRPAQTSQAVAKRRKVSHPSGVSTVSAKPSRANGKQRAFQRTTIEVPRGNSDIEDHDLDDEDLSIVKQFGAGASFLQTLDEKGISRSKREQDRLRRLDRPTRRVPVDDDLPSVNSHTDDEEVWSSDLREDLLEVDSGLSEDDALREDEQFDSSKPRFRTKRAATDSDAEMSYEAVPRRRRPSWSDGEVVIDRLPIKLRDGKIKRTGPKLVVQAQSEEESEDHSPERWPEPEPTREDITTGARFGRLSVIGVISNPSRKSRIQLAKEQVANICQEIVADPENSLGLLRRLHTFTLMEVSSPVHPEPVANDPYIRKLTMLSQLAVFKDIIPGYRIRELTVKEKAEKVSQMVARTREWEQGLTVNLRLVSRSLLISNFAARSGFEGVALQCLCTLLVEVTHFNFRTNIMSAVVGRLSKKSWDEASNLCMNSVISVFRADQTGVPSLEVVRLLNRMVKERRFNVHPNVLTCLLHLRLKTELGVRASEAKVEREEVKREKVKQGKKSKGQGAVSTHISKRARKALKERKEIEKEMKEAEAGVDKEERTSNQSETLKLLFVLYFRILKNPAPTPLLPAALQGISKYAHLVSVDFFRDLMRVLKDLVTRVPHPAGSRDVDDGKDSALQLEQSRAPTDRAENARHQLSCILTAYELLSGQGEALNIDLSDFTDPVICPHSVAKLRLSARNRCARRRLPIVLVAEKAPRRLPRQSPRGATAATTASANMGSSDGNDDSIIGVPPWRAAAFAKRLLTAALHWPGSVALRALEFVAKLVAREPRLEALLSTEDCTVDGVYRPDVEDPQLSNPFATSAYELYLLQTAHVDVRVRGAAIKLANYTRT